MKIKEVCNETELTERTIRFYIEKGLISPKTYEKNGRTYYDYSEENVQQLIEIATLRKVGFTIEAIIQMRDNPNKIDTIIDTQYYILKENSEDTLKLIEIFERVVGEHYCNIKELVKRLQEPSAEVGLTYMDIEPELSKGDNTISEEIEDGNLQRRIDQIIRERRKEFFKRIKKVALGVFIFSCILGVLILISGRPRTIDREYTGVQFYRYSGGFVETTNIRISGKFRKRWFSDHVFKGVIEIDSVELTKNNPVELVFLKRELGAWLTYYNEDLDSFTVVVYMKNNFEKVAFSIGVPMKEYGTDYSNLVLCAPAENMSEGTMILREIWIY